MTKKIKLSLIFTLVLSVMVCLFGGIMMQSASASNEYQSFVMNDLASIKISEETAIRFTTEISKSDYQAVQTKYGEDAKIEIITVITRTDYLNKYEIADKDFTIDNLLEKEIFFKNIKFSVENGRFVEKDDKYICNACLYNVDVTNVAEKFSARSFLCVNDSVIDKTDYSEEKNAVSVYEVAKIFNGQLEEEQNVVLAELCADYEIKIAATDYNAETSITVKVGETINDYKAEIESKLNIENFAYFAGLEGADMNAPVESGATYTPNYRAVIMEENETGYTVKGITLKDTDTTVIEIPETFNGKTVNTVGSGAFWCNLGAGGHNTSNNTAITKIVLPESVTTIKGRAFSHLGKLETIIMPGVTTIAPTGDASLMFYDCAALKTIVVGESLSVLQGGEGIKDHRIFYSDVEVVGVDVYYSANTGWWSIHEPSYSNRMLSGKQYYYSETDCLNTWKYDANGNVVRSTVTAHASYKDGLCEICGALQTEGLIYALNDDGESYSLAGYTGSDTEVYVASIYNGKPVTGVKENAFWYNYNTTYGFTNDNITKVVLPKSITLLESSCFRYMQKLETMIMPGVTYIDNYTYKMQFYGCASLKTVVVGESFKIIGSSTDGFDRTFNFDDAVTKQADLYLTSKDGVVDIFSLGDRNRLLSGNFYYYNEKDCTNTWRYDVNGNVVKSTVTEHSYVDGLCENCGVAQTAGLTYTLNADEQSYSVTGYTGTATEVYVAGTYKGLPVTAVGYGTFWTYNYPNSGKTNNGNITKVVLPKSITTIGGRCLWAQPIHTLIMPGVTYIEAEMQFHDCRQLKTVVVGESFTVNGSTRCFSADSTEYAGVIIYLSSADGTLTAPEMGAVPYNGSFNRMLDSSRVVHYSEKGCIGTWKYVDGTKTDIVLGSAKHSYKDGVCENCGIVQVADLVDEQGVTYGYDATKDCYYVADNKTLTTESIVIPATYDDGVNGEKDVEYVADSAFSGNTSIKKVVLPASVVVVGHSAFHGCTSLEYMAMPGVQYVSNEGKAPYVYGYEKVTKGGVNTFYKAPIKTLIVSTYFEVTGQQFNCGTTTRITRVYSLATTPAEWTGDRASNCMIRSSSGNGNTAFIDTYESPVTSPIYYYSEETPTNANYIFWHYDANGMPVLW